MTQDERPASLLPVRQPDRSPPLTSAGRASVHIIDDRLDSRFVETDLLEVAGRPLRCILLFVYGTLLPGGRNRSLVDDLPHTDLGPATTPGRLIDLGPHPGLLSPDAPEAIAHGRLLRLADAHAALQRLDELETASRPPRRDDRYRRVLTLVSTSDDRAALAWTYRFLAPPDPPTLIEDGRWRVRGR